VTDLHLPPGISLDELATTPGAEAEEAVASVRAWVGEHVPQAWRDAAAHGTQALRAVRPFADYEAWYPTFARSGLAVATWPVAYGGLDLSPGVARRVEAELAPYNLGRLNPLGLNLAAPYVKAVRERLGGFIGVQVAPVFKRDFWKYDWLIDLGTDHFSFCYEFHNPAFFERYCPGKCGALGQRAFFEAMEYTAAKLGPGAVSGEIIAGLEPIEDTLAAIDYITSVGAFPTVCIFRPLVGSLLEGSPSPDPDDMKRVFAHLWDAMVRNGIPSDVIPHIQVSLIVNPGDAAYLARRDLRFRLYRARMAALRTLARPYFARRMKPRTVAASAAEPPAPTT